MLNCPDSFKMKKQMNYANKSYTLCCLIGEDEMSSGLFTVKYE